MLDHQSLVAEDGDARDRVHVLRVQEMDELGQVVNVHRMLAQQRMLESNVHAAVGVFNVEDDRIAADFAPVADDAQSVIAGGHQTGQINGADFKIFGDRNRLLGDGRGENSGDGDLLPGLEKVGVGFSVRGADRLGQFGGSEKGGAAQILPSDGRDCFAALCRVDFSSGSRCV